MTPQEFAKKVREKYPGAYDALDDVTLAQKVIEKYPVYASQVNFEPETPVEDTFLGMKQGSESLPGRIASEEIQKTGSELEKQFSEAQGVGEKALAVAGLPLKAAGTAARIGGRIIAEPMIGFVKKAADTLSQNKLVQEIAQGKFGTNVLTGAADISGRIEGALAEIKKKVTPDVYQSLADSAELALWAIGGRPATKVIEKGISLASTAAKEAIGGVAKTGAQAGKETVASITGKIEKGIAKTGETINQSVEKIVAEPLQPQYITTLKRTTPEKFDLYANTAKKAAEDFKNATPLEMAGKEAQKALDTIQRKLDTVGQQKNTVLNRASVGNKPVGSIVVKFRQQLQNAIGYLTSVEGDTKLYRDILEEATKLGSNPTAKQVDKFIDFIQDRIYTGSRDLTIPITDAPQQILRPITGQLNEALKSQLPDSYRSLNDSYSSMVKVRNELNLKLGKEGERGGSLMKRVFSPSDARTKEMFEEVKKLTGVDLVDEATLARMTMEIAGDSRQASLLQQLNIPSMTKTGILGRVWDEIVKKYNTPEERFRRARELIQQEGVK